MVLIQNGAGKTDSGWETTMSGMRFFAGWLLGLKKTFSATTQAERDALYRHVKGKSNVGEIGVYHGANTRQFVELMDPKGTLWAVYPFFKGRFGFSTIKVISHRHVGNHGDRVRWIENLGCNAATTFAEQSGRPVDFIFVDGDHSWDGISGDWKAWRPQFDEGCIVALHDSADSLNQHADSRTGSVRSNREVISRDPDLDLIEVVDSLTLYRCRSRQAAA